MPALEMAQETGRLLRWLKRDGEPVKAGEPLMEIETDKVTVEIESPASGVLAGVTAQEGEAVPVGQTIAWILPPGAAVPATPPPQQTGRTGAAAGAAPASAVNAAVETAAVPATGTVASARGVSASPVARRIAEEHGLDLAQVRPDGGRVEKADVLAFMARQQAAAPAAGAAAAARLQPASPKARRLAAERGIDLATIAGSGPEGAVLVADLPATAAARLAAAAQPSPAPSEVSTVWRRMAEHVTASWTQVPHFYLVREVAAGELMTMRSRLVPAVEKRTGVRPTYTDLLVRLVAAALREHPRINATWEGGSPREQADINVGLATAVDDGLLVPVIHRADTLSVGDIAVRRQDLVKRAAEHKLRPADVSGGTFTISNLGMYGVDAFNAIVNAPQAAILAVGRIAERVVPVNGQPAVRPMLVLTLSCDHRVVDGARAAQFLGDLANFIEEPWRLLA